MEIVPPSRQRGLLSLLHTLITSRDRSGDNYCERANLTDQLALESPSIRLAAGDRLKANRISEEGVYESLRETHRNSHSDYGCMHRGVFGISSLIFAGQYRPHSGKRYRPKWRHCPRRNGIVADVERGTSRTLTTDDSGEYNAPSLTPSTYRVHAEAMGFKAVDRENVVLEVNGTVRVDFKLQPGDMKQTITVTEAMPLVDTTNAELGGTIQHAIIENLPLNGRNFENLLALRPGVTIYTGGGGWTQSTNGIRPHDNMYLVDGGKS